MVGIDVVIGNTLRVQPRYTVTAFPRPEPRHRMADPA
jgi:hypothetical protein